MTCAIAPGTARREATIVWILPGSDDTEPPHSMHEFTAESSEHAQMVNRENALPAFAAIARPGNAVLDHGRQYTFVPRWANKRRLARFAPVDILEPIAADVTELAWMAGRPVGGLDLLQSLHPAQCRSRRITYYLADHATVLRPLLHDHCVLKLALRDGLRSRKRKQSQYSESA
jgi:hypothetical protein